MASDDNPPNKMGLASDPTAVSALVCAACGTSAVGMINEVGVRSEARSAKDALRMSEGEVLKRWRDGLGVVSKAELNELVRTAHVIRDALRPDQVGERPRLP